jgi:hypothetical protein
MTRASTLFALAAISTMLTGPAEAQLVPGPNISPNGYRFTFSPRAGYLGPPTPIYPGMPPLYAPPPGPPPMLDGELCIVDPDALVPGLLNVRLSPNGWPIGLLPNGTQIVIREYAGDWAHVVAPIEGWVFRPLLACPQPSLPPNASAYAAPHPRQVDPLPARPAVPGAPFTREDEGESR